MSGKTRQGNPNIHYNNSEEFVFVCRTPYYTHACIWYMCDSIDVFIDDAQQL